MYVVYVQEQDMCGASLANIGDINNDVVRGKNKFHPQPAWKEKYSIDDLVVGCPQTSTGAGTGRMMLQFLTETGGLGGFTMLPTLKDEGIAPVLEPLDNFGSSLAAFYDYQDTGVKGIVVGTPGMDSLHLTTNDTVNDSGGIYIVFLRRRRYHGPVFDWVAYYLSIFVPITVFCICFWGAVKFFFWYFRRKPDEVEIMVKASEIEITKNRERKRLVKLDAKVYADDYVG